VDYFSHDQSRSRAYRWGEDGLGGISDDKQRLCFALALWNERDPILKERLFGLTNSEGNHGEDVKEYYFYVDSTPTHSFMKYLYKYPQREFPYRDLGMSKPNLRADHGTIKASDPESGEYTFSCDGEPELLFPENESNVDVQLVQLPVAVIDRDGRAVNGLTKQSFEVFEDGVQQEITFFRREDIPVSVGLLIDNSASMHNKRQRVNAAALAFARESNPQDETFIVGFDDEVFLDQDFTNNIDDLTKAFSKIDTRGQTAVYDAISLSVNHVRQGRKDKKALLLISDGEDNASRYNFETALAALRKSDVVLYAIGLLDEPEQRGGIFRKVPESKVKETLTRFAQATGGQAYFPKSVDEVDQLCRSIAHDLRNQYMIGYSSSNNAAEGSWRRISDRLTDRMAPRFTVRAKPGYYAPNH